MRISTALGLLAATFGTLMALSPLLQARVMLANKSSRDVSIASMWLYALNSVGWLSYGVALDNAVIMGPNIVALACLSVAITLAFHFRVRRATVRAMGNERV